MYRNEGALGDDVLGGLAQLALRDQRAVCVFVVCIYIYIYMSIYGIYIYIVVSV